MSGHVFLIFQSFKFHCWKEIQNHIASEQIAVPFGYRMLLLNIVCSERTWWTRRNWSPSAASTSTPAAAAPFRKSTSGNGRRPHRPRRVMLPDAGPYGTAAFNGDTWSRVLMVGRRFLAARSLAADQSAPLSTCWRERARTVTDDRYIIFATGLRASRFTVLAGCWTRLSLRAA